MVYDCDGFLVLFTDWSVIVIVSRSVSKKVRSKIT